MVYQSYAPYLYAIVKNYFKGQEERKDVLQEIFAQIFTSIHRFDATKGAFKSWISKIAVNQCAYHLRKRSKLHIVFSIDEVNEQAEVVLPHLEGLDKHTLEQLLHQMPEGYRTVFLLHVVDGYKHKEISERLGIKEQSSRSQLARAIKWIRQNTQVQQQLLSLISLS